MILTIKILYNII